MKNRENREKSMDIMTWALTFAKHRHMMKGEIVKVEQKGKHINVLCKNNIVYEYFVLETLEDIQEVLVATKNCDENPMYSVNVVCLNTKNNLKRVLDLWQELVRHQRLVLYFVNPNATEEKKWIIKPWLHNKISDQKSLEHGIKALFAAVEEVV